MDTPEISPVDSTPPYKDRSTGLILFGIMTILLGCVCGLFALSAFAMQQTILSRPGAPPASAMLINLIIYGFLSIALIWLGIGSIMARRWARALILIFSWSWLLVGVISCTGMAVIMPKIPMSVPTTPGETPPPQGTMAAIMVVTFIFMFVIFVILPAIWTFFYASRNVKATVEVRDPVTRWTDRCPLPVLALCVWLAFGVPMMLCMPAVTHGVVAFFGNFVSGVPGSIIYLVMALIWGYSAWSLYKLEQLGWWLILIVLSLFAVSSFVTFERHDLMDMYRQMGYNDAQLAAVQAVGFLTTSFIKWWSLISMLLFIGYLLFIKKYLRREPI